MKIYLAAALFLLAFWLMFRAMHTNSAPTSQFVTISPDKKYLINSFTNKPVFLTGDDAWTLITELSDTDMEMYLADRATRGFNVIWVAAVDNSYQARPPKNHYGNVPFDGADFTNEDVAYWAHVDYVVQRAQAHGITLMIDPAFVGLLNKEYQNSYLKSSDAVMTAYGTFLGNRYKGYPNIIWALGGDADPSRTATYLKLDVLAKGIAAADPNHLFTFEAKGGYSSLDAWRGSPSWLGLNWAYEDFTTVVRGCRNSYGHSPFLPAIMGEDSYEITMTGFQVRQEGYWEILSGCYSGRIFGNDAIWTFNSPTDGVTTPTWQSQLSSVGSLGQEYLGTLMRSREHWLLVPDTTNSVLTGGYGSGPMLSVAARTSDGQTIIAYFPNGNATTKMINIAKIASVSASAKAWWYNPRTGKATLIGSYPNTDSRNFTAPDGNDWVLVIDDASAKLPAPGEVTPLPRFSSATAVNFNPSPIKLFRPQREPIQRKPRSSIPFLNQGNSRQ